jgi:glycosyltransferase involved in cell wall biosynthesis
MSGFHPLLSMSWGYDLLVDAQRSSAWRWATRYTLKHTDLLLGDCETIRQRAISLGMPSERILTFPWGVDLRHFTSGDEALPVSDPPPTMPARGKTRDNDRGTIFTLLSTRSWEPIYGVDILARGFALAARQRPELRLIMLGNGSMAAELRRIFMNNGVEELVQFPGQASQGELPRYHRLAHLYLSASHSDGSSISLLEAMACGRPALLSDIPGNREWITPGENGWLFKDGDAQALAEALLVAVENRHHLPAMGRTARRLVEQRADWEQNFPRLLEAYEKLLPGGK